MRITVPYFAKMRLPLCYLKSVIKFVAYCLS